MNLAVQLARFLAVDGSSALSLAQRALPTAPSSIKETAFLMPVSHKR